MIDVDTPHRHVVAGLDIGLQKDSTGLVIQEYSKYTQAYKVIFDRAWKPGREPLRPTQVLTEIYDICRAHGVYRICSDIHYYALVSETLPADFELIRFPSSSEGIAQAYQDVKYALGKSEIDLSLASDTLIKELLATSVRPTSGGGLAISHERRGGSHGDLAAAYVAAFWGLKRAVEEARPEGMGPRRFTVSQVGRRFSKP